MKYLALFKALLKREFILMGRYLFDTISGFIGTFIIFLFIFFGARALGGGVPGFGGTLDAIVVGFLVWSFATFAYGEFVEKMEDEAQEGTLEQLYMSPVGFTWVCLFQIISSFFQMFTFNTALLVLMMATTGHWLHLDVISLLPLILLTLAGVYGIGFIMGGLALIFKRIQSFVWIFQWSMVGLIAAPIDQFPVLRYLPLAEGSRLIRQVMVEGLSLGTLLTGDLLFLAINAIFYFGGGLLVFNLLLKTAKNRGLLGHY